jgi:hypothetical protein
MTTIWFGEALTIAAGSVPKATLGFGPKLAPVMVTLVEFAVPEAGDIEVMVGGSWYWNCGGVDGLVPIALETVRSTVPAARGGLTAVKVFGDCTTMPVAGVVPNFTVVPTLVKSDPVIVTVVPPAVDPMLGVADITCGTATVSREIAVPQF